MIKGVNSLFKSNKEEEISNTIDYNKSPVKPIVNIVVGMIGFIAGFICGYIIYKSFILSLIVGILSGLVAVPWNQKRAIAKRRLIFKNQFKEFLAILSVSMRAGRNITLAIEDSIGELRMLYSEDSDIIVEVNNILLRFENGLPLRTSFKDLSERVQLDDVTNFAIIFEVIEGKSDKILDIIRQTSQIISEKNEIELEIEALIAGSKNEATILLFLPLVIMGAMNMMGGGLMVSEGIGIILINTALILWFLLSYYLAKKITHIDL